MQASAVSRRPSETGAGTRPTNSRLARRRERPGGHPVFQNIGVVSADLKMLQRIVPERWMDPKSGARVCAVRRLSVVASAGRFDVGDGTHANHVSGSCSVSRAAVAAALALEDVAGGERLVAFALASFANREQLAWPGIPAAAARAGLGRSRYLEARGRLLSRGLIETCDAGGGRWLSTSVLLRFVEGRRFDAPVNAELFETVLCYSRSSGPARLLLASIAALSDEHRELAGFTADELCAAAGLADRTYHRARNGLIASGELELLSGGGGRGCANRWRIADLRIVGHAGTSRPQRRPPSGPARPLMRTVAAPAGDVERSDEDRVTRSATTDAIESIATIGKGGHDRTVSAEKGGQDRTVSAVKGGQDRTVYRETVPKRVSERVPRNARAWKEPENHRTSEHPPNPPEGGLRDSELFVEESYVTERGRKRTRLVRVDVDAVCRGLTPATSADCEAWLNACALMRKTVGASGFEIWLSSIELVALDRDRSLVLTAPEATLSWVQTRFGRLISHCCEQSDGGVRFASTQERAALDHDRQSPSGAVEGEQSTMNRRAS